MEFVDSVVGVTSKLQMQHSTSNDRITFNLKLAKLELFANL